MVSAAFTVVACTASAGATVGRASDPRTCAWGASSVTATSENGEVVESTPQTSRSAASACQSAASVSTLIPVPRAMPHDAATLPRWRVSVVPSGQLSPLARTGDPGTRQPNSGLSVPYQASPQLRDGLGGFSSHPFSSDRMDLG
jgi:hypothetical protein